MIPDHCRHGIPFDEVRGCVPCMHTAARIMATRRAERIKTTLYRVLARICGERTELDDLCTTDAPRTLTELTQRSRP